MSTSSEAHLAILRRFSSMSGRSCSSVLAVSAVKTSFSSSTFPAAAPMSSSAWLRSERSLPSSVRTSTPNRCLISSAATTRSRLSASTALAPSAALARLNEARLVSTAICRTSPQPATDATKRGISVAIPFIEKPPSAPTCCERMAMLARMSPPSRWRSAATRPVSSPPAPVRTMKSASVSRWLASSVCPRPCADERAATSSTASTPRAAPTS